MISNRKQMQVNMLTLTLWHSARVSLNVPAKPATPVTAKHQPWDVNRGKTLLIRIAGIDKEPTNLSASNTSYSNLLKAVFKAEE